MSGLWNSRIIHHELRDLEKLFLTFFFEDDTKVNMHTFLSTKQHQGESLKDFVERFYVLALQNQSGITQKTLVDTCRHNLQTSILIQIGVAKCRTRINLLEYDQIVEEIVAWLKAEERSKPPKSERPPRCNQDQSGRKETMATDANLASISQPAEDRPPNHPRKMYSFKDDHVELLFKLLHKGNKLKRLKPWHPEEVGKNDSP